MQDICQPTIDTHPRLQHTHSVESYPFCGTFTHSPLPVFLCGPACTTRVCCAWRRVPMYEPEAALTFYQAFLKHTLP